VVRAILEGVELRGYADRAGISMNTVRFHLKNVFVGTENGSQAQLVRSALSALTFREPLFRSSRSATNRMLVAWADEP
jgi:DNA-binding NarL/FixJ family response regulator